MLKTEIKLIGLYKQAVPDQREIADKTQYLFDIHQDDITFYDFVQRIPTDWILLLDNFLTLRDDADEWLQSYVAGLEDGTRIVVDAQAWLPLLINKKWLLTKIPVNYKLKSLSELHTFIREEGYVKIIKSEWPIVSMIRPSAKERYNQKILKRWWDTYKYDYIIQQNVNITKEDSQDKSCIPWEYFEKEKEGYYDILVIDKIPAEIEKQLCKELSETKTIISRKGHSLYLTSENTLNKKRKQEERNLEQAAWLLFIKAKLAEYSFFIRAIGTDENCTTYFIFQHVSYIKIKKNSDMYREKRLAVLIDMPGIGDAVRLTSLLPGIKKKYPEYYITLIINVKANIIYRQNPNIDEMFICSMRPDPPGFPYIITNLISDLLVTRRFNQAISLTWDTTAYFNNEKLNFIDVYARIAGVDEYTGQCITTSEKIDRHICSLFNLAGIDCTKVTVGLQFNASMESKSWSNDRIRELIDGLISAVPDIQLVNLDFRVIEHDRVFNVGENLSILEFISAIKNCDFFIGVDSAGGHIAAAFNIPSITIYGKEKPRIGNDHRPLSNINIGIIPPDDCECPEYTIVCTKPERCINLVSPSTVIYALWKSKQLKYYKQDKKFEITIPKQVLWDTQSNLDNLNINSRIKTWDFDCSRGLGLDVTDLSGENLICDYELDREIEIQNKILGIDVWIEKGVFRLSSYGMMKVTVETSGKRETILRAHRLHEGWNLLRFPIQVDLEQDLKSIRLYLDSQKVLCGKLYINTIYFVFDKND